MVANHIKISWRNLKRNPGYSFLNVGGLAMGSVVALVVALWIADELSFNKSFDHYDRIAQVMVKGTNTSGVYVQWAVGPPCASEIRKQFGDDFDHMLMFSQVSNPVLATPTASVVKSGYFAEADAPEMLTLKMLSGNRNGLANMNSIMLSKSAAVALFKNEANAIGKSLRIDNRIDVSVTGVYEDIPFNTDFADMQFVAPWDLYVSNNKDWMRMDDWRQNGFMAFGEIKGRRDFAVVSNRIKDIKLKHSTPEEAKNHPQVFLHPMSKWRLYGDLESPVETGRIKMVWMFGMIGAFVLALACINFMNMATAASERRAKEVGVRKTIGSGRGQLIFQFFCEALMVTLLSSAVALIATYLLLPLFNQMAEKEMVIPFGAPLFWASSICYTLLAAILAGSYPAFYLSSFHPGKVLKGKIASGGDGFLRKALVVFQFSVSIALMVGVTVVFKQIEKGKERSLGFDPEGLLWVTTRTSAIHDHIDAVRNELITSGKVTDVAEAADPMTRFNFVTAGFDWTGNGPNNDIGFRCVRASAEYGKTIGWTILEGRDFSRAYPSDTAGVILNETSVAAMQLKNPLGTQIRLTIFDRQMTFRVIGVVKDVLMESPYSPVRTTMYMADNQTHNYVNVRISKGTITESGLAEIQKVLAKYDPSSPFVFDMASDVYARKYGEEERIGKLAGTFASLAILISMLGMLGLGSFVVARRSKEIAVRKVFGASVGSIWKMLSTDFVLLVVIGCLIAIPMSWYYMNDWLQQFEVRTDLNWYIFAFAFITTLTITLATVSYQTIRAAIVNPVTSLKME